MKSYLAKFLPCALCVFLVGSAVAELEPTVWADIPDVAPLRVGDTYYMTQTTMHFTPGIPIMASTDLVDWKTVSYCYDTIEEGEKYNLENGADDYGNGTWASSIRYNDADQMFYVSSFNRAAGHTYLFRAKSITGPWEKHVYDQLMYDHSLWLENGRIYFFASEKGVVYRYTLKSDFSGFEPDVKCVCPNICNNLKNHCLAEGSQLFKKDGWYYLVNIVWPKGKCRTVDVHRARTLDGPFDEAHVAFEYEGIAQGSFIDKPDGSWVAVLFADRGGVGRVPFVLPVEWKDGWPTVKRDVIRKKGKGKSAELEIPGCVANDDFSGAALKLEWQWNHNPDNAHWKLADGKLALTTSRVDHDLLQVRNVLTQRTFGPTSEARVTVDGSAMKSGDKAGIALFQFYWGAISLKKLKNDTYDLVIDRPLNLKQKDRHLTFLGDRVKEGPCTREVVSRSIGTNAVIHLKAVCDFTPWKKDRNYTKIPNAEDAGRFYYSLDGQTWEALGEAQFLPYTIPHFVGYRFALFNWATKEAGGTATFDDYEVGYVTKREQLHMDGTNPIVKTRHTADPAGVVDGDWFYLFMGHDEPTARGYKMRDWSVVRTQDMRHWEDFGAVLDCGTVFPWARPDKAWASQPVKDPKTGKWFWYLAVSPRDVRTDSIAVAVADRPEGPWKDAIGGPLVSGYAYIDPSVFIDDDGSAWLFWGNCGGDPGCWYAKLKPNRVELDGDVKPVPGLMDAAAFGAPLFKERGAGHNKSVKNGCDTNFEEAPWIYKVGDTYYLEYAAGGVPESWSYSTAKSIHGPWTFRGKIMENAGGTGTIHGGSVLFKGQWYLVYHDGNLPGGADCRRSACIEPYVRNPDGSIPFLKPTAEGVSAVDVPKPSDATVTLGTAEKGHAVPKSLWGIFFEDINWAADGGLNPEMLANGGFDWGQADHQNNPRDDVAWNVREDGWEADFRDGGMARLSFQYGAPVHPNTAKHLRVESFGTGRAGVRNRGLDGMWMKAGEPYRLVFDWREIKREGIDYKLGAWRRETVDFTFDEEARRLLYVEQASRLLPLFGNNAFNIVLEPASDGRVTLSLLVKGRRAVEFDNVSLQPTGPNMVRAGLRKDLVDKLADLHPAFVRFPGGCIVEEGDFQHWYDWRRTVGPMERRECIQNRWAGQDTPYWETFGVGYYEFFRLCEEIGAEPLPICLSGLTCQYQKPAILCDVKDADYFAGVILELIEFANGDPSTTWGKVRAEMGHPAPFNLKMVGIGNENWGEDFFGRCEPIAKIIREKHPEIKIVGSAGPSPDGRNFDYAWSRVTKATADLVDEHYYRDPDWFLKSAHRYDHYDRTKPQVYAGEYACHHRVGKAKPNTLWSAVCEAAAMTGFERNSDVVAMASYAPLFAREGHTQWAPNLIWFDGTESWVTPNYYVQQLFAANRPDVELPVTVTGDDRVFACAGTMVGSRVPRDRTIVKLVNANDTPRAVTLNRAGEATITTLAGGMNTVNGRGDAPVKPVTTTAMLSADTPLTLPTCSVTLVVL